MKKIVLSFLILFWVSFGQELKHIKDVLEFTQHILYDIEKEETQKAIHLFESSVLKKEALLKFQSFIQYTENRKIINYRLFHEKDIFNAVFKISYLVKYQKDISVISFYFYRPYDRWYIYDFSFETDIKKFF